MQESLEGLKGKGDVEMSDVKKEIQSVKGLLLSRYVVNPNYIWIKFFLFVLMELSHVSVLTYLLFFF